MNIFETLGPKLRRAILLTESNRAMREILKGNIHPMALQRKGMLRPAERMERGYLKGMENKRAKHGIRDLDYAEQHQMALPYNNPGYAVDRRSLTDHATDTDTPKRARKAARKFLRSNPNDRGWTHTLPGNESVVRGHETDELLSKAKSHATIGAKKRGDKQPMQIGSHRGLDVLGKEMQDTARLKAHGSSMGDKVVMGQTRTIVRKDNTLKTLPARHESLQGMRHKTGEYDLVRRKAGMDPASSLVGPKEMRKLRNARHDVPGAFMSQPPERPVVNEPMARKAAKMKRRQLRVVSKGLSSKYGDKFMQMRGDKPNYADRFKGKAASMMTNKTFGNIPESATARAGNLQEGLWDSIKSGARYIARGAANTLGKIHSAGVVDARTFNRDARNVGRVQRAVGSETNIGLTHDAKLRSPSAATQLGRPGNKTNVALVALPPEGKRSARALAHEVNHIERGAKGPLSDEGLKARVVSAVRKTKRKSLMKQADLHVKLQKGEITDEQFGKKAHKARRAERRLKRAIGNDLDKFDHINTRRSLRDEAKASAGLLRRGPKGVKGMETQSAFRTYITNSAPSKFKGGDRQLELDRKVRAWQGNKTPLPRSPEQMQAPKPVLSEHPEVKRKRDELAHRLRNFRKAGGLYPEGLTNKAWLKLSATARAGNLQEALAEQTRAMIPKNKFAAPTMPRIGHEDKGLYPIFNKKSAKSALKLSGKHPHLKQEITRRAAVYGVKLEKKGTRYA